MATRIGSGLASGDDSYHIGHLAATQAITQVSAHELKLAIVFASTTYDLPRVLQGVRQVTGEAPLMGCSSAGEFTESGATSGAVSVALISSDTLQVRLGVGTNFTEDLTGSVTHALADFVGNSEQALRAGYLGRTLFLMTDGLTGKLELLIDAIMAQTAMQYQLFGGAAGDDAQFKETFVFYHDQVLRNAFVCAEVLSVQPLALGIRHGWRPASRPLRITAGEGARLREINGMPAWELYEEFADQVGVAIDDTQTSAFLMNYILGVPYAPDQYKLRVPLWKEPDGSLICAAEVPEGALTRIMETEDQAVIQSGRSAVELAQAHLGNTPYAGALVFECVATRLRLGAQFSEEIEGMKQVLGDVPLVGCNSYGQLARVSGEFTGLMDATALVCLIPS